MSIIDDYLKGVGALQRATGIKKTPVGSAVKKGRTSANSRTAAPSAASDRADDRKSKAAMLALIAKAPKPLSRPAPKKTTKKLTGPARAAPYKPQPAARVTTKSKAAKKSARLTKKYKAAKSSGDTRKAKNVLKRIRKS